MSTPVSNSISTTGFDPTLAGVGRYVADGVKWGGAIGTGVNLTYSYPTGTASFVTGYTEFASWYTLTNAERTAVKQSLDAWSAVANITFTLAPDNSTTVGDLRFAMADMTDFAHAYFPSSNPRAGDVWFGHNDWNSNGGAVVKGDYDYLTIIHEIGHALGLKHTFSSPNVTPVANDSMFYSVMSYTASPWANDNFATFFPTTPMYYDLAAIQAMYGRNMSHNAGNTTYTFTDGQTYFQTIDDASGTDTIVFNGTQTCEIDLRDAAYSAVSEAISFSGNNTSRFTVCIGPNTVIENATGGSGNDKLIGNAAANTLKGNSGNDVMNGSLGDDVLFGANGRDVMAGGAGHDQFVYTAAAQTTLLSTTCDVIADFVHLTDRINFGAMDASSVQAGDNAFVFTGTSGFGTSSAGGVRYAKFDNAGTSNDYTIIYCDTDADASSEFIIKLTGLITLTAADFVL